MMISKFDVSIAKNVRARLETAGPASITAVVKTVLNIVKKAYPQAKIERSFGSYHIVVKNLTISEGIKAKLYVKGILEKMPNYKLLPNHKDREQTDYVCSLEIIGKQVRISCYEFRFDPKYERWDPLMKGDLPPDAKMTHANITWLVIDRND